MIALDTNLLVYAHREDSPWRRRHPLRGGAGRRELEEDLESTIAYFKSKVGTDAVLR